MNTPQKKYKPIPSWLGTTAGLLAIVTIILIMFVAVTCMGENKNRPVDRPDYTPTPTPTNEADHTLELIEAPLIHEDSQSVLFSKVKEYLTEQLGDAFSPDSLSLSKKATTLDGVTLFYAKYMSHDVHCVSELVMDGGAVKEASAYPPLAAFLKSSRKVKDVSNLFVQSLICNFYSARNAEDADALALLLSSGSKDDAALIISRMEYIDSVTPISLSVNPLTDSVAYMVLVSEEYRFIEVATPAPGLSEVLVTLSPDNYPLIFIGETDAATDSLRTHLKNSDAYHELADGVKAALDTALAADPALKTAYENMLK